MNLDMFSAEERRTLAAYEQIARTRNVQVGGKPFMLDFLADEFAEFRRLLSEGKVLDVGCGNGRDAHLFLEAGYSYIGIDASQAMLDQARILAPQAEFRLMDMCDLQFPPQSFDGLWVATSLLHIPKRSVLTALLELKRAVFPGGIVFFAMRDGDGEEMVAGRADGEERFFAFYREGEFLKILKSVPFDIIRHRKVVKEGDPQKGIHDLLVYFCQVL